MGEVPLQIGLRKVVRRTRRESFPRSQLTNLPVQWLQCQANGSNFCLALREGTSPD